MKLTDEDGNVFDLIGRTDWLQKHVGDELKITGIQEHPPEPPTEDSVPETTLHVSGVQTALHQNPSGVRPLLGDLSAWHRNANRTYGVGFRYPKMFERAEAQDLHVQPNFVSRDSSAAVMIEGVTIPEEVLPNSNFGGGSFITYVDPSISNQGTCGQFASFRRDHSSSPTIHGIKYTQTFFLEGSAAHASPIYYFHTFQNGLCYEIDFEFFEANTTGMVLPCSTQWVSDKNEFELMDSVLSQLSFLKPEFKPVRESTQTIPPLITSLTSSPVTFDSLERVTVSWSSEGADSVQLRYECAKGLTILGPDTAGVMKCAQFAPQNFDPAGSASFVLLNQTTPPTPVPFVLTVEPFLNGVGYPKQSKTISIPVAPCPQGRKNKD